MLEDLTIFNHCESFKYCTACPCMAPVTGMLTQEACLHFDTLLQEKVS